MHRCDEVGKLLERNLCHIRNLVNVTDHDYRLVRHVREAAEDALALIFLTCPWVLVLWGFVSLDDDVFNLVKPLGVTLLIFIKIERLGTTHVVHLCLDEYETVYVSVEALETELEHVKLIIEHKCVYEHLNL
jgi:hypothetical protein